MIWFVDEHAETHLGALPPNPPEVLRLGPKAWQGEWKAGRREDRPLSRFRTWTALGLLPSIALSSRLVVERYHDFMKNHKAVLDIRYT